MKIDRLEQRLQFAGLSGLVYNDADTSKTFDTKEMPMEGITVFIDANVNGEFDTGEQSTTTNADGRYVFANLPKGEYTVGTTLSTDEFTSTTATPDGTRKGRFDIIINGLEGTTAAVRRAFEEARTKWEAVILGDMPDVTTPGGQFVDDLVIDASIGLIDGVSGILGYAAPTASRGEEGNFIPYQGEMRFDSDDLATLQANDQLNDVILHEMGHVLGIGTVWDAQGLITGRGSRQPRFVGVNGTREYDNLFATNNLSIPIENSGEDGTRNSHFRENLLMEELMTGYEGPGQVPLSRITVGSLQDQGYLVNYRAADKWIPATHQVERTGGTDYGGTADERRISLGTRDRVIDLDLGYVMVTRPSIKSFTITPAPQAAGNNVTLSAAGITDPDGDDFTGVSFYRESNGIEGFQKGGDTFLGLRTFTKNRAYTIEAPTSGLLGEQTFYAFGTDEFGRVGKRQGVVDVQSATIPEGIPTGLAVRPRSANAARFAFTDTNTNASNYRIELATSRTFDDDTLIRVINLTGDQRATNFTNLREGITYYVRVRAYNVAGAGFYSQTLSFEVA